MTYEQLGGDATGQAVGDMVFRTYAEAGEAPNSGMMVWAWRTCYDISQGLPKERAIAKHEAELRSALGLDNNTIVVPPGGVQAPVAPRDYRGNMCGVRISGLPPVPGGARDSSLVLSWFYGRYNTDDRAKIRAHWKSSLNTDVLLSWPDDRSFGYSPEGFIGLCSELSADGLRPCVMLLSKYYDPHQDVVGCLANVNQVLPMILERKAASRLCIGFELGIEVDGRPWLLPSHLDELTDDIAPRCVAAGIPLYVHFQQGYSHLDKDPGGTFRGYWSRQKGKLTGLWHQRHLGWDRDEYKGRLEDILVRFSGAHAGGVPPDNGINGNPFDVIALEITAHNQYAEGMSEAEGNLLGWWAINAPIPSNGVRVMGSGNGQ